MSFLRFNVFSCFKYLSALALAFSLVSCSVSQPDPLENNTNSNSFGSSDRVSNGKALKVSWNAPLKREDNSALELVELAEYRVYYGVRTGKYDNVIVVEGNSTFEAEDSNVGKGTYYVAVTAIDSDGLESGYSQEIVVTI